MKTLRTRIWLLIVSLEAVFTPPPVFLDLLRCAFIVVADLPDGGILQALMVLDCCCCVAAATATWFEGCVTELELRFVTDLEALLVLNTVADRRTCWFTTDDF